MKMTQKILSAVVAMLLTIGIAAPATSAEPLSVSITIGGVALDQFTIVYPKSDYADMAQAHPDTFSVGQWDFGRLIAEYLQSELLSLTGIELPIAEDAETEQAIRITTNGDSGKTGDYAITGTDADLTLFGDSYGAAYHAVDYLIAHLQESGGSAELSGLSLTGTHKMHTISCFGDSLTSGCTGWEDEVHPGYPKVNRSSYPSVLGRLLWKDCIVLNFGENSVTLTTEGSSASKPYTTAGSYNPMMEQAANSDLTIIMLGTNDIWAWNKNAEEQYTKDYNTLVSAILEKNPDMAFLIANVPYMDLENSKKQYTRSAETIGQLQLEIVEGLQANGITADRADIRSYTVENCTAADFTDQLHFTGKGYTILAQGMYEALKNYGNNMPAPEPEETEPTVPSASETTPATEQAAPVAPEKKDSGVGLWIGIGCAAAVAVAAAVVILRKKKK